VTLQEKLKAKMEEMAHAHRDKSDVMNEDWTSFSSYKAGFAACADLMQGLVEALDVYECENNWHHDHAPSDCDEPYCCHMEKHRRAKEALSTLEKKLAQSPVGGGKT
jgi:hypothetical protein